jgi:hypothetical protein
MLTRRVEVVAVKINRYPVAVSACSGGFDTISTMVVKLMFTVLSQTVRFNF